MKRIILASLLTFISVSTAYTRSVAAGFSEETVSTKQGDRYYIDPVKGNDQSLGTSSKKPWRTFRPLSNRQLRAGSKVTIQPGTYRSSLVVKAQGSSSSPVTITLAKGKYHFYPDSAYAVRWHISNTNDVPDQDKLVAILIRNSSFVSLRSDSANIIIHGKMIETAVDHSDHVSISGLSYDYHRPTVSELTVTATTEKYADLKINFTSTFSVADSVLWWEGEGWRHRPDWYWQVFDPATGFVERQSFDFSHVKFVDMGNQLVRAYFPENIGFKTGLVYQTRDVLRDCAGIFMQYSSTIRLEKIHIRFMHGMGIVSQYCKDITMRSVQVRPGEDGRRTCAAWADILHFSGCSGKIEIADCYLSAANDDAINVHGTHLKIMERPDAHHLKVRFMHNQSYGFDAFFAGDSIEFVRSETLLPFGSNVVTGVSKLNDREVLLTLKNPVSEPLSGNDVVENVTHTPEVWIHNNTITRIPTRGILITTRKKVLIEKNKFLRVNWNAIVVADDAESWFESGPVKDLSIRNNEFIECGGAVTTIVPENKKNEGAVHQNITVEENKFALRPGTKAFSARNAAHLKFLRNQTGNEPVEKVTEFTNCSEVIVEGND